MQDQNQKSLHPGKPSLIHQSRELSYCFSPYQHDNAIVVRISGMSDTKNP